MWAIPQGTSDFFPQSGRLPVPESSIRARFVQRRSRTGGATLAQHGHMAKELGFNVELRLSFEDAVTRVREALKQEGFGVLTEIDLRAAFREKLGREFRPYVILGACNPPLAFSAISTDPSVGLLLPCNVTVERLAEGRSGVRLTDPEALLNTVALQGASELSSVARDARERMVRVAASLATH
jgi:uncharacterized protein (DUF302 family)